jgi:hypothetical protein
MRRAARIRQMLGNTAQHLCRPVTTVCLQCDFLTKCLHCLLKYWPTFWKQDVLPAWPHSSTHIRVNTSEFGPPSGPECVPPAEGIQNTANCRLFIFVLSLIIASFFRCPIFLRSLPIISLLFFYFSSTSSSFFFFYFPSFSSFFFFFFLFLLHTLLYFMFVLPSIIALSITYSSPLHVRFFLIY